jgi:ribonuclease Z
MMSYLEQAYDYDIRIRPYGDQISPDGAVLLAEDIGEGVVYEKEGVKITAFEVDHTPVKPAFGYRIDHAGRSVVLSGDTRISENLIRYSQGVDVLIHNVAAPETLQRAGSRSELKALLPITQLPRRRARCFHGQSLNWPCIRTLCCRPRLSRI